MSNENLKKLYVDELKDLFSAESQLLKALPKMAKAASSEVLRSGFEKHLEQTNAHVQRLEEILESLDESPKGKTCHAMKGLIEEGSEMLDQDGEESVLDAGIIAAAQKVEHYEMAGYGTVRSFAEILGEMDQADLLENTLDEEKNADAVLTQISDSANTRADKAA